MGGSLGRVTWRVTLGGSLGRVTWEGHFEGHFGMVTLGGSLGRSLWEGHMEGHLEGHFGRVTWRVTLGGSLGGSLWEDFKSARRPSRFPDFKIGQATVRLHFYVTTLQIIGPIVKIGQVTWPIFSSRHLTYCRVCVSVP